MIAPLHRVHRAEPAGGKPGPDPRISCGQPKGGLSSEGMPDHPKTFRIHEIKLLQNIQRLLQIKQINSSKAPSTEDGIAEKELLVGLAFKNRLAAPGLLSAALKSCMIGAKDRISPRAKIRTICHGRVSREARRLGFSEVILPIVLM